MPELPEIETVRRALAATVLNARIRSVAVHEGRLRQPVDRGALERMAGAQLRDFSRIGKYLVVGTDRGTGLLIHLGMSGTLRVSTPGVALHKHDHLVWSLLAADGERLDLRYRDPRRFGLVAPIDPADSRAHPLLRDLGPDPIAALAPGFLYARSRRVARSVKSFLMDPRVVVGIGNIYACEGLWRARVNPRIKAGRIGEARWARLQASCVRVLEEAIAQGGTTLKDFRSSTGAPGYFSVALQAYGREGLPCSRCAGLIRRTVLHGRSTFACPGCQY